MKLPLKRCEAMTLDMARRLSSEKLVTGVKTRDLYHCLRDALVQDLSVEDQLNEEIRELLDQHSDQMKAMGADYHEAFKKMKSKLVRDRKLIL